MKSSEAKDLRKQLRNVAQELLPDLIKSELCVAAAQKSAEVQKAFNEEQQKRLIERLDTIESECRTSLKKQDERARAVQGFLVQTAMQDINNFLHNTHITMLAWQEVVAEKIGDIPEFNKLIDDRKKIVSARLQAEAEAKMAEAIRNKDIELEAKKQELAAVETPATEPAAQPEAAV